MLFVTADIQIADAELEIAYARSSGPGGQNVNKVNSKAVLHWNPVLSGSLSEGVRARFLSRFYSRLNKDGAIVIMSDRFRDQGRNREDCLDKLRLMLLEVAHPPKPRKKTRPSRTAKEKRKVRKRRHGEKKRDRSRVRGDE
ncbi:MAG: alternative ribosome rescue aminoacyl-tRNA hydrolase ArfB [Bdellovibrionota bacterium]